MLNKKHIDIYLHFITTKPGKGSVLPKKQNFPVDMKSIIPQSIAFTTSDINTDMSLQSMESLLSTLINTADINGFDRIKHRHYLDKNSFSLAHIYMALSMKVLTSTILQHPLSTKLGLQLKMKLFGMRL